MSICSDVLEQEHGLTHEDAVALVKRFNRMSEDSLVYTQWDQEQIIFSEVRQKVIQEERLGLIKTADDAESLYMGNNSGAFGSKNSDEVYINAQIEDVEARLLRGWGGLTRREAHGLIDDPEFAKDFVKEMVKEGSSGNKGLAYSFAKEYKRQHASVVLRANAQGASIVPFNDPVGVLQWHDPERMIAAGKDYWVRFTYGLQRKNDLLDEEELGVIFDHFTNSARGMDDIFFEPHVSSPKKGFPTARRLTNRSLAPIYYLDADAWLKYNREFGHRSPAHAAVYSLRWQGRLTFLTERLGPDPMLTHEAIKTKLKDKFGSRFTKTEDDKLDWTFNHLAGNLPSSTVPRLTALVNTILNLNVITKMGFATPTAMMDIGTASIHVNYQGVSFLKSYARMIKETVKGQTKEQTNDIFRMLHAGNDGVFSYGMGRYQIGDSQPGALASMTDSFVHAIGLVQFTNRLRTAYVKITSMHMADMARAHSWTSLPKPYQKFLGEYGLDAGDWKLIRKNGIFYVDKHVPDVLQGKKVDRIPSEHYALPEQLIRSDPKNANLRKVANKLSSLYHLEVRMAVPEAGLRAKKFMMQGQYAGTSAGEALRLLWQFRTPTIQTMFTLFPRMRLMGPSGFMHLLPLTGLGYATLTAKDFFRGRSPRDPNDSQTFMDSMAQTGIFGVLGDMLAKSFSYGDLKVDELLLGTTWSTLKDFSRVWGAFLSGERGGLEAYNFLKSVTPAGNVFYSEAALNYFVHDRIREMLHPGFTESMNAWMATKGQVPFFTYQPEN